MAEYVMVPVPSDRVMEVYALLAGTGGGVASDGDKVDAEFSTEWTDGEIKDCFRELGPEMQRFFELLAEQADEWVRSDELYPQLGYTAHQFAGATGSFGRRIRSWYGKSKWFIEAKEDPETGLALYTMTERVARLIREASNT